MAIQKKIEQVRPIINIKDNVLISRLGSYSIALELQMNHIFTMSNNDYENCSEEFSRIFNLLPDNSIVHKMDVFSINSSPIPFDEKNNTNVLTQAYNLKFNERPYIEHKSYIFITKTTANYLNKISLSSLIFKKDLIQKELLDETEKNEFFKSVSQISNLLNDSQYYNIKNLSEDAVYKLCENYENLSFNDSNVFSSDIYQNKETLTIGNNHLSCIAINSLNCFPNSYEDSYIDPSFATNKSSLKFSLFYPLGLGLHENHIVNQVFIKETEQKVKDNLEKTKKDSVMFSFGDSSNQENVDDVDRFSELLNKGHNPIKYHANVILWKKNKIDLTEVENKVITAFNKIKFTPNITYGDTLPLYWSCYPGNIADLGTKEQSFYLLDRQAAALNVFETNNESASGDFGVMLSERLTGAPIYVDISDEPIKKGLTNNRNKIIVGPSGSGKSFTTNTLINNYLRCGSHIVIVDVGDSYERLCQLYKGKYFKYDENKPLAFNPFNAPKEQRSVEKKESLISLLFTLWKKNPEDNTRDEYKILSDSISKYYDYAERLNLKLSFNTYFEYMKDVFVEELLKEDLEKHFDHKSFFNVLNMFYKGGEYDYLLNNEEDLNLLNEQFIVFELDNIKDHKILFPVVTLMIMETFITKMRLLKNTRKVILLEEAWKAIANEGMAGFMKYLYKTVRKHFGEAWMVTQELEDILGNEIVKNTILKNCGAKILLDMREYAEKFDDIQNLLGLNNTATELVLSLNQNNHPNERYKEVFFGLGNQGSVYGVNVSKEEYACYTTEKIEKEKIEAFYEKHGDIELALKQFAETI